MFERFIPGARLALVLAQEEARTLNYGHIGTGHLLLGLLSEKDGVGAQILARFDTLPAIRQRVLELDGSSSPAGPGRIFRRRPSA